MTRTLTAFLVLASVVAALSAALSGCGGDGEEPAARQDVGETALERKVHRLEARVKDLRKRRARQERREQREAREAPAAAGGAGETGDLRRAFASLENKLGAEIGATIGSPGRPPALVLGSRESGSAWSTIKVPMALALIEEPGPLTSRQSSLIAAAISVSDNQAAEAIFGDLVRKHGSKEGAAGAIEEVLREAGDQATQVSVVGRDGFSPYGQTEWSLPLQHLFISRLAASCIGDPDAREIVLGHMREVGDAWGLGAVGAELWKGGWGPGTDGRYEARQMGVLDSGAVVTLAVASHDGSFGSAQSAASEVARLLASHASSYGGASLGC